MASPRLSVTHCDLVNSQGMAGTYSQREIAPPEIVIEEVGEEEESFTVASVTSGAAVHDPSLLPSFVVGGHGSATSSEASTPDNISIASRSRSRLNSFSSDTGSDIVYYRGDKKRTKWEEATIYVREGEYNNKFFNHPQGKWSKLAYSILHHPVFYVTDLTVSILLMLLAILEEPSVISVDDKQSLVIAHGVLEILFLFFVAISIVLRLVWFHPYNFIKHVRSVAVTVVVIVMLCEAIAVIARQKNHFRITRALRPLFFVDTYLMDGLRRVLRQMFYSLKPIIDVLLLLLFTVTFFSLIGHFLFAADSIQYFSTFAQSYVSMFILLTTSNNPDVFMETYDKLPASPIFFMIYTIFTVYFISNVLLAVVYGEFSSEDKKKFKKIFLHRRKALHHAYTVLKGEDGVSFGDFLMLMKIYMPRTPEWQVMCIFKAMHKNPNAQHQDLTQDEFYNFYELKDLKWNKITCDGATLFWYEKHLSAKLQPPFNSINKLVTWYWFNTIIIVCVISYFLFLVVFALKMSGPDPADGHSALEVTAVIAVSFVVNGFFCMEIFLRVIGLGPLFYFSSFWNIVDFVVVIASMICFGIEIKPSLQFLLAIRPIVLLRILRLKHRYQNIINTLATLRPRLISAALLIIVIYYFYAIIGMEMFGADGVFRGCCNNSWYNIEHYYKGPQPVSAPELANDTMDWNSTLENNETVYTGTTNLYYLNSFGNILRSYVTLFILMVVNNWFIIMEGFTSEYQYKWLSRIFFMSFYIITLVVLQVVISFIVEAFVLRIHDNEKLRFCSVHHKHHSCPHVEAEASIKEVEVAFVDADIRKIKYELIISRQKSRRSKYKWSFNQLVKEFRKIDLDNLQNCARFRGHRRRTKDDVHLRLCKNYLQEWITEQEREVIEQAVTSQLEDGYPWWKKVLRGLGDFITYIFQ